MLDFGVSELRDDVDKLKRVLVPANLAPASPLAANADGMSASAAMPAGAAPACASCSRITWPIPPTLPVIL